MQFNFVDTNMILILITDKTVVVNPGVFLTWLRSKLETAGVKFIRKNVNSLSELKNLELDGGHDLIINATGVGSLTLQDVQDKEVEMIRGQTILVRHNYEKAFQRDDGTNYTYAIPRLDGSVILGGVRQFGRVYVFSFSLSLFFFFFFFCRH